MMQAETRCSDDYAVAAGQPCVPVPDLDCTDLETEGIGEVEVVGTDVFGLDRDGDGVACEGGVPGRTVTGVGETAADAAPWALPVLTVLVAVVVSVGLLHRARGEHAAADEDQRGANRFTLYLSLGLALPLLLIGALVMALIGID